MKISTPHKIYISDSPIHGLGVFANEIIYEGEIIEICPVIDMGLNKEVSHILIDYRYNWPQGNEWTSQVVATGYAMLYNHSDNPNSTWRSNVENNTFEFYAIKQINPNEEIFTYYGDMSYWNDGRTHTNIN
jgi:SET domain-containing protein